jgi:hypothetical protein
MFGPSELGSDKLASILISPIRVPNIPNPGENPRIIEEKLKAFMAPKLRAKIGVVKEQKEGA